MSFITFDYQCKKCSKRYPNMMVKRAEMDKQICGKCYSVLQKLPAGPITTFKFNDRSARKSRKAVSLMDKN